MKDLLAYAVQRSRADHTEIRLERTWATSVAFRGSRLEIATTGCETGGMVRCLNRGKGWGVVSFTGLDHLVAAVHRAHELSLAVSVYSPIRLAPIPVLVADHLNDLDGDVRGIGLDQKRAYLERLNQDLLATDRRLISTFASYQDQVIERWVATSEGSLLFERRPLVRLAAAAVAREESFLERAFESWSTGGGWRSVQGADHCFRTAGRRAIQLLGAGRARSGVYPVVLDPRAFGALVHHALGHLVEAPTVGDPPEGALLPGQRVGSELLIVGDDGSASSRPGSLPFDDEGAPAQNTLLIQHGVVVGRLHTRETAARNGERPTGNARAGSFRHPPQARLTNTYVANGRGTLEDLLRGIKHGLYGADAIGVELKGGRFQLQVGHGQRIEDGQLGEVVKPFTISGGLMETLQRLDALAGDFRWNQLASSCGRAGAGRIPVAEGAPHGRLDGVTVVGDPA